ncbi:hypothetical protein Bca4012_000308 [Brassica carinata]
MEVVSPIPSSASQRRLKFSKSYFQALGVTGVGLEVKGKRSGETTITRLVPSNSNSNLEIVKTEPNQKEIIQGSGHWWGRSQGQSLGYLDSVTFDASEVLVTAGAASQNNEGCGGMARKICFLRLNVKGWSSFKEFIDKEVYKDLADVEVKLSELEAELSETNVVKCT